jgi:hypothetical protein
MIRDLLPVGRDQIVLRESSLGGCQTGISASLLVGRSRRRSTLCGLSRLEEVQSTTDIP